MEAEKPGLVRETGSAVPGKEAPPRWWLAYARHTGSQKDLFGLGSAILSWRHNHPTMNESGKGEYQCLAQGGDVVFLLKVQKLEIYLLD